MIIDKKFDLFRDWLIARGFFDYGADEVITRFRENRPDRYDCDLFDRFMRDYDCHRTNKRVIDRL